jgi:hypothetical protein
MAEMAQKFAGKEDQMRRELRETVKQFLEQFQNFRIEDVHIDDGINEKLFSLACFVAEARSGVSRDRHDWLNNYSRWAVVSLLFREKMNSTRMFLPS